MKNENRYQFSARWNAITVSARILALDVGDRRIGVAVSDPLGLTAQPQPTIDRQAADPAETIAALAGTLHVERVVVGLPLTLRGERGPQAQKVIAFAEALQARLSCPVVYWDERFSTHESHRALRDAPRHKRRQRGLVDQTAALLILQGYLEAQQHTNPRE